MKQNKETVKEYFETGDKPTQAQYSDLIDSYVDIQQEPGEANRRFVIDETGEVNVVSKQEIPDYTLSEITNNKIALLKDGISIQEIDLTSYIDDTNLSRLISGTVDGNGLATFVRDDASEFTVDLSNLKSEISLQELTDVGNETNNGLIINTTGSDVTNVFNSDVLIKTDHKEEGIYIPHMIDVKREASDEDAIFYGGMHRAEYYGEEPIKEVFGKYNIGRITGEGSVTSLGGQINVGSYRGSGDVTSAVFGTESRAQIENYGEEGVNIAGVWNRFSSSINNAVANVENAVANSSSLELQKGTIETASVHRLDLVNPTVQNDPDLIVTDFAYLRADDTVLNFEPETAHFIKSSVPLPSLLSGIVETNVSQEAIENASEKVLVTKEYVNAIYAKKVKTINTATVQTSATLNSVFPLAENPIGSQVVNLDLTEGYMYIRISDTSWRKFALGTAI